MAARSADLNRAAEELNVMEAINFLETIWGDTKGIRIIGEGNHSSISPRVLEGDWKTDARRYINHAIENRTDLFFCPALFNKGSHTRASFKSSQVAWVDSDESTTLDIKSPNLIVSSGRGQHLYWILKEPSTEITVIESINRDFQKIWEGDSKFSCSSFLRIPTTYNTKYDEPRLVKATTVNPEYYAIETLIDRSKLLFNVASDLKKQKLPRETIRLKLIEIDKDIGKYTERPEEYDRILDKQTHKPEQEIKIFSYEELLEYKDTIEWGIYPFVTNTGTLLFVGDPGTGKTQLSIYFSLCLGEQSDYFKGTNIQTYKPLNILFISLEMRSGELAFILKKMHKEFNKLGVKSRLKFWCPDDAFSLEDKDNYNTIQKIIKDSKPDGVIIDSLSTLTTSDLQDGNAMRKLFDKLDHIKTLYDGWLWIIHHQRKSNADNKTTDKLSDVYGSQHITARVSSVFYLERNPKEFKNIKLKILKSRFSSEQDAHSLKFVRHIEGDTIWFMTQHHLNLIISNRDRS